MALLLLKKSTLAKNTYQPKKKNSSHLSGEPIRNFVPFQLFFFQNKTKKSWRKKIHAEKKKSESIQPKRAPPTFFPSSRRDPKKRKNFFFFFFLFFPSTQPANIFRSEYTFFFPLPFVLFPTAQFSFETLASLSLVWIHPTLENQFIEIKSESSAVVSSMPFCFREQCGIYFFFSNGYTPMPSFFVLFTWSHIPKIRWHFDRIKKKRVALYFFLLTYFKTIFFLFIFCFSFLDFSLFFRFTFLFAWNIKKKNGRGERKENSIVLSWKLPGLCHVFFFFSHFFISLFFPLRAAVSIFSLVSSILNKIFPRKKHQLGLFSWKKVVYRSFWTKKTQLVVKKWMLSNETLLD